MKGEGPMDEEKQRRHGLAKGNGPMERRVKGAILGGKEAGARPGGNAMWQHQETTPCGNAGGNARRQHAGVQR